MCRWSTDWLVPFPGRVDVRSRVLDLAWDEVNELSVSGKYVIGLAQVSL